MKHTILLTVAAVMLTIPAARADIPGMLNYQGRITVSNTNFNGTGQFKFALVNSGATQTYWSNGVNAVSLTVTKGLYSVLLGDTTLANMANAIQPTVFTNSDVRLRVWFNDGVNGLQQLTPDQRLAASGYALMANVADGSVTSNKLAAGAVTTASIASNAVTAAQLANGSVTSNALAAGAVGSAQLASNLTVSGTVTATLFAGNANGLTNLDATDLTGTMPDARLSGNVALLNAHQTFTASNRFAGTVTATNAANIFAGTFSGNGGGLTNLDATDLTGTVPDARLSGNVALLNAHQTFTGSNRFNGTVTATNVANTFAGTFLGNGGGLTNVVPPDGSVTASKKAAGAVTSQSMASTLTVA